MMATQTDHTKSYTHKQMTEHSRKELYHFKYYFSQNIVPITLKKLSQRY